MGDKMTASELAEFAGISLHEDGETVRVELRDYTIEYLDDRVRISKRNGGRILSRCGKYWKDADEKLFVREGDVYKLFPDVESFIGCMHFCDGRVMALMEIAGMVLRAQAENVEEARRKSDLVWGRGLKRRASPCHVYVVSDESSGMCKVGISSRINKRMRSVRTNNPTASLYGSIEFPNRKAARDAERAVHHLYASRQVSGEWFEITPEEAMEAIKEQAA